MLDDKKLSDVNQKLFNIIQSLSWVAYNNPKTGHTFSVMAVKSLLLQVKTVEAVLEELTSEEEV